MKRLALALSLVVRLALFAPTAAAQPVPGGLLPPLAGGGVTGAVANFKGDMSGGIAAKLIGTLISGGVQSNQMHLGTFVGVVSAAKSIVDPAFLLGNLPGGVIGGALGAAIPLPAALSRLGFAGEMMSFAPPLLGAMFGSALLMHAVDLAREHKLTLANMWERLDVRSMLAQAGGIDVAVLLARHLIPAMMLGPVNLTEVGAALLGGWVATKLLNAFDRHHHQSTAILATALQSNIAPPDTSAYADYIAAESRGDAKAAREAYARYVYNRSAWSTVAAKR